MDKRRKHTTENFIARLKVLFVDKYTYENTVYKNYKTKVKIFCIKHQKDFEISPSKILEGGQCQLCAHEQRIKSKHKDTKYFITKAKEKHKDLYNYDTSVYTSHNSFIEIFCNTCRVFFTQKAGLHLNGSGHPSCAYERGMDKQRLTTKSFVSKSKELYGDKYSYDWTIYKKNNMTKVLIKCEECKTICETIPNNFLSGVKPNCECTKHSGFNKKLPGIVYYLSINNGEAFKIGITNRTVEKRFNNTDLQKITILKTWSFEIGIQAQEMETKILKDYKEFKYLGEPLLSIGNSELFNTNILSL